MAQPWSNRPCFLRSYLQKGQLLERVKDARILQNRQVVASEEPSGNGEE